MHAANFCVECGERLARKGWRAQLRANLCERCAQRLGRFGSRRSIVIVGLIAVSGFAIGRYLRPSPPPLIIQRAANSPLSDAPLNANENFRPAKSSSGPNANANLTVATSDDAVYICGARTQKGTPCRRRVHVAGERCFQHKGLAAMVPPEKLTIKP
jgi:hypothetical protein